jgi:hypothetical protein
MINIKKVITVRVIYKSGYAHNFDVYSIKFEDNGRVIRWTPTNDSGPLMLGIDNIEAVYYIKHKYNIVLADWVNKLLRISQ